MIKNEPIWQWRAQSPDKDTVGFTSFHSFCSLFWDAGSILDSKPCPSSGAWTPITPLRLSSILVCSSGVGSGLWDLGRAVLGCAGRSAQGCGDSVRFFWEAVGNVCMLQAELTRQDQFHIKYSQCLSIPTLLLVGQDSLDALTTNQLLLLFHFTTSVCFNSCCPSTPPQPRWMRLLIQMYSNKGNVPSFPLPAHAQ